MYLLLTLIWTWFGALLRWHAPATPAVHLELTPRWTDVAFTSIDASMTISGRRFDAHRPMLELVMVTGRVPSMDYTGDETLRSWDAAGPLELVIDDTDDSVRRWHAVRPTTGDVHLGFTVYPRQTTKSTPPGPRVDFRNNGDGLIGTGNVFIPTILDPPPERRSPTVYELTVSWDLDDAPPETSTVWTFGEGRRNTITGRIGSLVDSVYTVGTSIRSYTTPDVPGFGFYWLTDPPRDLLSDPSSMARQIAQLFPTMSEFFDRPSDTYRVFLRESPRGYGGGAYEWSFIIEWDRGVKIGRGPDDHEGQADDLYFLIAHEMVHNWPSMQGPPGESEGANTTWYEEGIATYYQAVLPHANDLISTARFVREVNSILSAYYTSPAIHMSSVECAREAWSTPHAQRLPYHRSVLFLLHLEADIRRRSSGRHTLRDPVNELVRRRFSGQTYTFDDLVRILVGYTDVDETMKLYMDMSAGSWTIPPPDTLLDTGAKAVRRDQRVYEAGFETAINGDGDRAITRVTPGSNAEAAGCRAGDVMTWSRFSDSEGTMNDYERNITMTLRRPGIEGEFEVGFWPRGRRWVESWQYE